MTPAEKQMVFGRVMDTVKAVAKHGGAPAALGSSVRSPWSVYSFASWIESHRWISAVAVIAIVILAGNSAVLASHDALPGDTLYPIKVGIVEPIRVALAPTPVAKAEIQTEIVMTRLQESETLAAQGALTEAREQEINQRVAQQTSELAVNVSSIKAISPEKAQDINTTVEAGLNTHERVLAVLAPDRWKVRKGRGGENQDEQAPVVATKIVATHIKGVEVKKPHEDKNEKVTIVARAVVPTPQTVATPSAPMTGTSVMMAPVAMTAPAVSVAPAVEPVISAAPARVATKVVTEVPVRKVVERVTKNNPEYQKKKDILVALLKTSTAQVDAATSTATSTPAVTSSVQRAIIDEAKATLRQAQDQLNKADEHDRDGEVDKSYSTLIDSERSAKEAVLLIDANVRLKNKRR
jgi:hypothetical protein